MPAAGRKEGLVIRALGGFFFIFSEGETYRCVARGTLKKREEILVGDRVVFTIEGPQTGVVEHLKLRSNQLVRPPIANVDMVIVVLAVDKPAPNYMLVDRILVQAEAVGLKIIICLNKCDLLKRTKQSEEMLLPYRLAGYRTYTVSSKTKNNVDTVKAQLYGFVSVLAGQSGVGKSSLLNVLEPGLNLATGEVSQRTWRGRHTTRQVELLPLDRGGWVADTPGFSTLVLPEVEADDLVYLFPELGAAAPNCRFPGCRHENEPDCAVRIAVASGLASEKRYESYLTMARELRESRRKW
ncbi:MAG: ribosome small subunit-dependent GTPase A [bacterium]